jgi:precorrin-6A/cobalt-precorrin-6A reductase
LSVSLGHIIFLATGSKTADFFIKAAATANTRLVFRILSDPEVIILLIRLGVDPGDIVAMRGPFGYELNIALFQHYRAEVLVTKESGAEGGQEKKLEAAMELRMPVVLIRRPRETADALDSMEGIVQELRQLVLEGSL